MAGACIYDVLTDPRHYRKSPRVIPRFQTMVQTVVQTMVPQIGNMVSS
jgi:hypothetical protein